jgi:N-acetylglucosaminyldiphosphoundecaprenol N-acetyl-beta-D-mannosaminyltransferase
MRGEKSAEQFPGPELLETMLARGEKTGHTHYFYGGTPESQNALLATVARRFPGTKIAGHYSPPFRELTAKEDEEIIRRMNEISPDFIWVGLGAPKQEIWMARHAGRLHHGVLIGVGAAFNFLGGTVKRAPKWMQWAGVEWFYRMLQERRLVSRYLRTNFVFLAHLPFELFRRS